jgi:chitinase
MATNYPGWEDFPAILNEYLKDSLELASNKAKTFVVGWCAKILDKFKNEDETQAPEPIKHLLKTTRFFGTQLDKLKFSDTPVAAE